MTRRLSALAADARGAGVMELALLAPVLALVLMGMVDVGRALLAKYRINQVAIRTVEKAYVGSVRTDYSYLKDEASAAAGVPPTQVTVDAWLECDGARQPQFDANCAPGQMSGRFVSVTVADSYRPSFGYGPLGTGSGLIRPDGTVALTGRAVLRLQ
jgi:hypothetical protein